MEMAIPYVFLTECSIVHLQSHSNARTTFHAQFAVEIIRGQCIEQWNCKHKQRDEYGVHIWFKIPAKYIMAENFADDAQPVIYDGSEFFEVVHC